MGAPEWRGNINGKDVIATSFRREYCQLQVHLLLLCIWLQVNLMSYVKLSTYRDFRIKANFLQAADNQNQSLSVSVCSVTCIAYLTLGVLQTNHPILTLGISG